MKDWLNLGLTIASWAFMAWMICRYAVRGRQIKKLQERLARAEAALVPGSWRMMSSSDDKEFPFSDGKSVEATGLLLGDWRRASALAEPQPRGSEAHE